MQKVRLAVLGSGVIEAMLDLSRREFRAARRRAGALGAQRVAAWAGAHEAEMHELYVRERESAGYAVRYHALGPWMREVFR